MKRNHMVDLTSLLDIILILLFAFMINIAGSVSEQEENTKALEQKAESLQSDLDKQQSSVKQLETSQKELLGKLATSEVEVKELEMKNIQEAEAVKTLIETISEWIGSNEPLVSEVTDAETAEKWIDPEVLSAELQKYAAISKYYVFIEVELQTGDCHIVINDEATNTYVLEHEVLSTELRSNKESDIKELIEAYLDNIKGGYSFALITLSEDGQVKRAQYNLVWDAIKTLQQEKDSNKIFITQIQALRP